MSEEEIFVIINNLKSKDNLTDVEKDIVKTFDVIYTQYFDRFKAIMRMEENNKKYPRNVLQIICTPNVTIKRINELTNMEISNILYNQLLYLLNFEKNVKILNIITLIK